MTLQATTPLRLLVVEDEPPARRRLRGLLQQHRDVMIVGEATHGGEAVDLIERERPDVVLLDVELPVANGFEVIDAVSLRSMPNVIFVTAYDQYAIRAFEVHALDYLLKPVEAERLATALDRLRATSLVALGGTGARPCHGRDASAVAAATYPGAPRASNPVRRRRGHRLRPG